MRLRHRLEVESIGIHGDISVLLLILDHFT